MRHATGMPTPIRRPVFRSTGPVSCVTIPNCLSAGIRNRSDARDPANCHARATVARQTDRLMSAHARHCRQSVLARRIARVPCIQNRISDPIHRHCLTYPIRSIRIVCTYATRIPIRTHDPSHPYPRARARATIRTSDKLHTTVARASLRRRASIYRASAPNCHLMYCRIRIYSAEFIA